MNKEIRKHFKDAGLSKEEIDTIDGKINNGLKVKNKPKPTFKKEFKLFAIKLRRELIKRENDYLAKDEEWMESEFGQSYSEDNAAMEELWQCVSTTLDDLGIKIPKLK